jgi:XisH protein
MPRFDQCHEQVVHSLQKEGWRVEGQHVQLTSEERTAFVDIQARRPLNGTVEQVLLAEVKCFPNEESYTTQIYTAIGQYLVYRMMIEEANLSIPLYLSIPETTYTELFDSIIMKMIQRYQIKLMIVNIVEEGIVRWME